jgi:hypothetical protein
MMLIIYFCLTDRELFHFLLTVAARQIADAPQWSSATWRQQVTRTRSIWFAKTGKDLKFSCSALDAVVFINKILYNLFILPVLSFSCCILINRLTPLVTLALSDDEQTKEYAAEAIAELALVPEGQVC